jgi:hypothetical protein
MVAYATDIIWGPYVDMRDQDEDPAYDKIIADYEARWGPLTPATLARVGRQLAPTSTTDALADLATFPKGTGPEEAYSHERIEITDPFRGTGDQRDLLFLLEALGASHPGLAREVLPLYLHSPDPRERWTSAMWLSRWQDPRALPYLLTMLCEFLPPLMVYPAEGVHGIQRELDFWYNDWRRLIRSLLAQTHDARLVVPLRQALLTMLRLERTIPRPDGPEVLKVEGHAPLFY